MSIKLIIVINLAKFSIVLLIFFLISRKIITWNLKLQSICQFQVAILDCKQRKEFINFMYLLGAKQEECNVRRHYVTRLVSRVEIRLLYFCGSVFLETTHDGTCTMTDPYSDRALGAGCDKKACWYNTVNYINDYFRILHLNVYCI